MERLPESTTASPAGDLSPENTGGYSPALTWRDRFDYIWMNLAVLASVYSVYRFIPYYKAMLRPESVTAIHVILAIYVAWIILVPPANVDSAKSVLIVRFIPRFLAWSKDVINPDIFAGKRKLEMDNQTKVALISLAIKVFFFPLMINQVFGNYFAIQKALQKGVFYGGRALFDHCYALLYCAIGFIDTSIFSFSYAFEFGRHRIKDVEDRLSGWFVTLICYQPLVDVTFRFLPVKQNFASPFFTQDWIYYPYKTVIMVLWLFWLSTALSLGLKASNLTNRGIVTSGLYSVVRHPSYTLKNICYWLERIPFMSSPVHLFGMLAWNLIYFFRALTEERYLKRDPEYLEYCSKVKYRFIPGVF